MRILHQEEFSASCRNANEGQEIIILLRGRADGLSLGRTRPVCEITHFARFCKLSAKTVVQTEKLNSYTNTQSPISPQKNAK